MKLKSILFLACLFLNGCATLAPSYIDPKTGATVFYSPSDQNILSFCATTEAALPTLQVGASVATKLILTNVAKQSSTQARDGAYLWSVSSGLYSLTSGSLITPDQLKLQMQAFGANNNDLTSAADINGLAQNLSGVYTSLFTQLSQMANSTTNANVKAKIIQTGLDVLHALAGGVQSATLQYAPKTS